MKTYKKTILIDLDGVLNTYVGNYDENYIPPMRDGAYEFVKDLSKSYKIVIFTSRNLLLASQWIIENDLKDFVHNITNIKEPNFLIIDDRAINFNGSYEKIKEAICSFKPWYE